MYDENELLRLVDDLIRFMDKNLSEAPKYDEFQAEYRTRHDALHQGLDAEKREALERLIALRGLMELYQFVFWLNKGIALGKQYGGLPDGGEKLEWPEI